MARSRNSATRPTIFDLRYGAPPTADTLVRLWNLELTDKLLDLAWKGYDQLYGGFLAVIPWDLDYKDLERSITEAYVGAIEDVMSREYQGYFPCRVRHSPFERESQLTPKAQPPAYDLAFILNSDPRIMWPIEAKVLKTDKDTQENLGDYVSTLNERYLACKYAPFSNGGAMVCYMKRGNSDVLFANIASLTSYNLQDYSSFSGRQHKFSDHVRSIPANKDYPREFRCHHLVFILSAEQ